MEHRVRSYVSLNDLPLEMWLEIMHYTNWRTTMAIVLSCKYCYYSLRKYFDHPQLKLVRSEFGLPFTEILIKNGRIYYHSTFKRRDRIFNSMTEMKNFFADLERAECSFGHVLLPANNNHKSPQYRHKYNTIDKNGYRICFDDSAAERVFRFVSNFVKQIDYSIPTKAPGIVIISIGEKDGRKKICPYIIRKKRNYRWGFKLKFVLDADGNLEWTAPACYDYRTILAKHAYEDLKAVITSDKAHLKPIEILQYKSFWRNEFCGAFFKAKFLDKSGKMYALQRFILHENNTRVFDIQNYKETTFKSILKIMDRILDNRPGVKRWLKTLCNAKGRPTLPWVRLFRPPSECPYDSSNFHHE